MDVTGNGQGGEARPAIAVHDAAWNEMAFRPVANGLPGEVGNAVELEAVWLAVGRNLDSGEERRLAGSAAAGCAVGAGAPRAAA
jgi:hypothetical protein